MVEDDAALWVWACAIGSQTWMVVHAPAWYLCLGNTLAAGGFGRGENLPHPFALHYFVLHGFGRDRTVDSNLVPVERTVLYAAVDPKYVLWVHGIL